MVIISEIGMKVLSVSSDDYVFSLERNSVQICQERLNDEFDTIKTNNHIDSDMFEVKRKFLFKTSPESGSDCKKSGRITKGRIYDSVDYVSDDIMTKELFRASQKKNMRTSPRLEKGDTITSTKSNSNASDIGKYHALPSPYEEILTRAKQKKTKIVKEPVVSHYAKYFSQSSSKEQRQKPSYDKLFFRSYVKTNLDRGEFASDLEVNNSISNIVKETSRFEDSENTSSVLKMQEKAWMEFESVPHVLPEPWSRLVYAGDDESHGTMQSCDVVDHLPLHSATANESNTDQAFICKSHSLPCKTRFDPDLECQPNYTTQQIRSLSETSNIRHPRSKKIFIQMFFSFEAVDSELRFFLFEKDPVKVGNRFPVFSKPNSVYLAKLMFIVTLCRVGSYTNGRVPMIESKYKKAVVVGD